MNAGLIGYWIVMGLVRAQCILYSWVKRALTAIQEIWNTAFNAIIDVVEEICGTLSDIPLIGGFFNVVCWSTIAVINALGSGGGVILDLSVKLILGILEIIFWITIILTMGVAWIIHWFLARDFDRKRCVGLPEHGSRNIKINFVVLMHNENSRNITTEQLNEFQERTTTHLEQCGVQAEFTRTFEIVPGNYTVNAGRFFVLRPGPYMWFTCKSKMFEPTVFFIDSFSGNAWRGWTNPVATSFCVISKEEAKLTTLVHEVGHLCDIWLHSADQARIMYSPVIEGTSVVFTPDECCMIRTSRFIFARR